MSEIKDAQSWENEMVPFTISGAKTQIIGAVATLKRPVTRQELLNLTKDYVSEEYQEVTIQMLIKEGLIEEDENGNIIGATEYPGRGVIEHASKNKNMEAVRWRVRSVLGINNELLVALSILKRPVTRAELRKLTKDRVSEKDQEEGIRMLIEDGLIEEDENGNIIGSAKAPGKEIIERIAASKSMDMVDVRKKVKEVILGENTKEK